MLNKFTKQNHMILFYQKWIHVFFFTDYKFSTSLKNILIERFDLQNMLKDKMIKIKELIKLYSSAELTQNENLIKIINVFIVNDLKDCPIEDLIFRFYESYFYIIVETHADDDAHLNNCTYFFSKVIDDLIYDRITKNIDTISLNNVFDIYYESIEDWNWEYDDYFENFIKHTYKMIICYIKSLQKHNIKFCVSRSLFNNAKKLINGTQGNIITKILKYIKKYTNLPSEQK